jgi:glucose uptake protein GlcU
MLVEGMVLHVALALGLVMVTVVFHAFATLHILRIFRHGWRTLQARSMRRRVVLVGFVVLLAILTHMAEMGLWAVSLYLGGAIGSFDEAVYFTATTYTTVAYSNPLAGSWQLISAILAMVGWIMFGWTTGILVHVVGLFYRSFDVHIGTSAHGWE